MRIGELTREAGVTRKALRYYEAQGLLTSRRTPSGYREFDTAAVEVVRAIRAGQRLGLKLEDLRDILVAVARGTKPCADLQRLIEGKRAAVRRRIDELRAFDEYLQGLTAPVGPDHGPQCPIISRVNAAESQRRSSTSSPRQREPASAPWLREPPSHEFSHDEPKDGVERRRKPRRL